MVAATELHLPGSGECISSAESPLLTWREGFLAGAADRSDSSLPVTC